MILRLNRADSGGEVDLIANQIVALVVETDGNTTVLTTCGVSYKVTETARKLRFAIKRELSALTNAVRDLDDDEDEAKEDAASANAAEAPVVQTAEVAPTPVAAPVEEVAPTAPVEVAPAPAYEAPAPTPIEAAPEVAPAYVEAAPEPAPVPVEVAPEAQPESPPYTEPTPVAPTPVGDVQE